MGKLSELAVAVLGALRERRELKSTEIYVECLDKRMALKGVDAGRMQDIWNYPVSRRQKISRILYEALPELHEAADELVRNGDIDEHADITDVFMPNERKVLIKKVLELSGMDGKSGIGFGEEVQALKK